MGIARHLVLLAVCASAGCEPPADRVPADRPSVVASATLTSPASTALPAPPPLPPAPVPERDESALAARDPARVLDYYAAALTAGDWQAAARVWAQQADMSAARLQAAYGAPPVRAMRFDAGTTEGAAGSLYHEARFALRREAADEWQHGSVVLRRVNDVPGASEEQLRWHIERSTPAP